MGSPARAKMGSKTWAIGEDLGVLADYVLTCVYICMDYVWIMYGSCMDIISGSVYALMCFHVRELFHSSIVHMSFTGT